MLLVLANSGILASLISLVVPYLIYFLSVSFVGLIVCKSKQKIINFRSVENLKWRPSTILVPNSFQGYKTENEADSFPDPSCWKLKMNSNEVNLWKFSFYKR